MQTAASFPNPTLTASGPQNRCAACTYPLDGLPGAPVSRAGPMATEVVCPECGFVMPAGCHVLVGAVNSDYLTRLPLWRRVLGFLGANWLYLIAGVWLLPRIVEQLVATGTVSWDWRLVIAALLAWGFATAVIRFVQSVRRAGGDSIEMVGAMAASWIVVPGGIAQVRWPMKQTLLKGGVPATTVDALRVAVCSLGEPSDCIARISIFSRRPLPLKDSPEAQTGLLFRCDLAVMHEIADALAATLAAKPQPDAELDVRCHLTARTVPWLALFKTHESAFGERAQDCCPRCGVAASIPTDDGSAHPAWCAVTGSWDCPQCALHLEAGAVVAKGSTDGDLGAFVVRLGHAMLLIAGVVAVIAAVMAGLGVWDEMPMWLRVTAWPFAALCALGVRQLIVRGPTWRESEPLAWSNKAKRPMRVAWWTTRDAIFMARRKVDALKEQGLKPSDASAKPKGARVVRVARPAMCLDTQTHLVTAIRPGLLWRRFTLIPDDPRGFDPNTLHVALARALNHAIKPS